MGYDSRFGIFRKVIRTILPITRYGHTGYQEGKHMKDLITTAEIWKEGGMYTSYSPELDIASCGHTAEEARRNLAEVITIHLEETAKLGTLDDLLSESGYTREGDVIKTGKKIICFEEIRIPIHIL
jgi:predicted RNase H-like HicB family nuclease